MEEKSGRSEEGEKKIEINRDEILEDFKVDPADEKLRRYK
jgi:hypothetical protein